MVTESFEYKGRGSATRGCPFFLRTLIEHSAECLVTTDDRGRITARSRTARDLLGTEDTHETNGGVNTMTRFDLLDLDEEPLPVDRQPLALALRENRSIEDSEMKLRTTDGGISTISASAYPVLAEDGSLLGAVAIYRNLDLEEHAARMLEEWRSVISHDLRGPVVTIDLAARLLEDSEPQDPEEMKGLIERIHSATARLNEMIQNLSDATLVESKRLRPHLQPLSLKSLVEEAIESANIPKDRPIRGSLENGSVEIQADPEQLEQAIQNIIRNAVVHGQAGTPIELSIRSTEDEAIVAVTNQGPEIPGNLLPRIFERFQRYRPPGAPSREGLGLGLFVTRGLVDAHGGRVWVESNPGGPTTFQVAIPRTHASNTHAP